MKFDSNNYSFSDSGNFGKNALRIGALGIILSLPGYFLDPGQFFHSWLLAFTTFVSLGLGGMFFVLAHHLSNATWSIVMRRISEATMSVLPYFAIFVIPVLFFGMSELFLWADPQTIENDHLLMKKSGYLNTSFFIIRTIIYFVVWFIISRKLFKYSIEQDKKPGIDFHNQFMKISGAGIVLFALTISFAAFDWLMSLDPHWYSTIFGIYFFTGSYVTMIAFLIIVIYFLGRKNILTDIISIEHYHDLGKLLFAFIVFWAYIGGSQYFFIWYANIPEETIWYLHRWKGSWKAGSLFLMFGHFIIPFVVMIFRASKRNTQVVIGVAFWILLMHIFDLYWLIMPNLHPHDMHFSWMDLTLLIGMGGVFAGIFWKQFTSYPIIPIGDPKLKESIDFVNS